MKVTRVEELYCELFDEEIILANNAYVVETKTEVFSYAFSILDYDKAMIQFIEEKYIMEVIDEFRFYNYAITTFLDNKGNIIKEYDAVLLFEINIEDLRCSQFFVSEKKLRNIQRWGLHAKITIPVCKYDDFYIVCDGHTRLKYLSDLGINKVFVYLEKENSYLYDFFEEALKRNIRAVTDMVVISKCEYQERWHKFCDEYFNEKTEGIRRVEENEYSKIEELVYQYNNHPKHASLCCPKSREEIRNHIKKTNSYKQDIILGYYKDDILTGVIFLLVEEEDKYLQSLGYFCEEEMYQEVLFKLLEFLKHRFMNYVIDFVFPIENELASHCLEKMYAKLLSNSVEFFKKNDLIKFFKNQYIEELNEKNFDLFQKLYNDDGVYWTSDKLIHSLDKFDVLLYINQPIYGYIVGNKKNKEIYDLYFVHDDIGMELINALLKKYDNISILEDIQEDKKILLLRNMNFIEKQRSRTYRVDLARRNDERK